MSLRAVPVPAHFNLDRIAHAFTVGRHAATGGLMGAWLSGFVTGQSLLRDVVGILAGAAFVLWCARHDRH
ncbi:MAG: hypothetical protein J7598_07560 [Mitsuaria chitosanitabida]|jgi:hypothetical protein|uniref:hypothetical protein n=1 Tax=Roseateles chitosanitabidus TaxID=65048 RepID=UPI001B2A1B1B|nr:hypothetical protein [Roseateles chitosanitabidus]MBO9686451.1 hypothetical protein [Roseateles chitosanitabidus]